MPQQTWFITGVNSGFGRLMTEKLLERGDRVAGTARKLEQLADFKGKYGERLFLTHLDLTDTPGIRKAVDGAFAHFGRVDVVVNNAGYGLFGAAEELSDEQIRHQIETNLIGSIQVIRAALPHLRAQGGGRILQVHRQAVNMRFRASACITRPSGGLKVLLKQSQRRSRHLGLGAPSWNRGRQ